MLEVEMFKLVSKNRQRKYIAFFKCQVFQADGPALQNVHTPYVDNRSQDSDLPIHMKLDYTSN